MAELQRDQIERDDLRRERLGRGDTDLGAGVGVEDVVARARDRGFAHVADRERAGALPLALDQRGERVGRLAGLGDGDHERLVADNRLAVAVLTGDVCFDRDLRELLDHGAPDQRRVVRGAAGDQVHAVDRLRRLGREVDAVEVEVGRAVVPDDARSDRVGNGTRLLVDLLLHEAVVAALFRRDGIPVDQLGIAAQRRTLDVEDREFVATEHREVPVLEEHHLARVREQRGDVGAEEGFALADAEDDRGAALLGGDDVVGIRFGNDGDRVRTDHQLRGAAHGRRQIRRAAAQFALDQVRHEFGVGLGLDLATLGLEFLPDRAVVLDDPVVDHRDPSGAVRVRVAHRRLAVRRPARVADPDGARQRLVLQQRFERGELADRTSRGETADLEDGDARRVVAPVFEPSQSVDQHFDRASLTSHVADDSTHGSLLLWMVLAGALALAA